MSSEPPVLRLIRPENLEGGKALAGDHGTTLTGHDSISAAISMYLHWPKYRRAFCSFGDTSDQVPCEFSIDQDEAEPTELYLSMKNQPLTGTSITVRFEVFNVSYSFVEESLGPIDRGEPRTVIQIPRELKIHKKRLLPRTKVPHLNKNWRSITWTPNQGTSTSLVPIEISLNSILAQCDQVIDTGPGFVEVAGVKFRASIERQVGEYFVLGLNFENSQSYGRYFDLFRECCYSTLVPRHSVPGTELYETYKSTGFFDKYVNAASPQEEKSYQDFLISTWSMLGPAQHQGTVDYCTTDSAGKPIGASSLIRAFANGERDVWIMTQLCSKAEPQYFENTRHLYLWRAAYLCGLPGDFDVTCWIDGNSRFLERMWIKFIRQLGRLNDTYWPVVIRIYSPEKDSRVQIEAEISEEKIGEATRWQIRETGTIGGIDPPFLNFGKLLDHVASIPPNRISAEELRDRAVALARRSKNTSPAIRITTPGEPDAKFDELPTILLNRFCYFSKEDLPFLFTSMLHSLAVMERKYLGNAS